MKIYFYIFLLIISPSLQSQVVKNNSFEMAEDVSATQLKYWDYMPDTKAAKYLDITTVHSGKYALKMFTDDTTSKVAGFHQKIDVGTGSPKRLMVYCWVKTVNCSKGVGIECAALDSGGNELGWTNSFMQGSKLRGTNDWTKMKVSGPLKTDTKQLDISFYLNGSGTVWFDDISVEPVSADLPTAPVVTAYIDSLVTFVKANSIIADSINWNTLTNNLTAFAKGMQTYTEAGLLPAVVIDELRKHGDKHSSHMNAATVVKLKAGNIMGVGKKPEARYLDNGIGYISMPAFASISDSAWVAFEEETQGLIKKLDTENKICGWVVDLREDNGGSYPPMVIGLGPILGDGVYDFQLNKKGARKFLYVNGEIRLAKNNDKPKMLTKIPHAYTLRNKNTGVAVLIGPHCGSSGESTALAFVGRHDTKLFGQPTAGYTKGNVDYTLPDSSMIFISEGVSSDRNGKKYADKIFPDVLIDQPAGNTNDLTLAKAKEWLLTIKNCK